MEDFVFGLLLLLDDLGWKGTAWRGSGVTGDADPEEEDSGLEGSRAGTDL
jgi:hypothetical protein